MQLFALIIASFAIANVLASKKAKKCDKCVISAECRRNTIKRCMGCPNGEEIKKYCEHKQMLGTLQDIFDGDFGIVRQKRKLEQLNEGFEKTNTFTEEASCSVGGGTIMSFDGFPHTITGGPCTYVLAMDKTVTKMIVYGTFKAYKKGKFANRLTNVAIYFDRETLVLGEGFDINYQGIGYNTPAIISGKLTVWRDEHYIYAESPDIQARIRWDPEGQLKISVGSGYNNQTLGLCGLYNGDASVAGEHNSIKYNLGSDLLDNNAYSTGWALSGCYHAQEYEVTRRLQNCDTYMYARICSITHAAPELSVCLRNQKHGQRYHQECLTNMCLSNDIEASLYSETLRISNDCYDRLGLKITNADLKAYIDQDFVQMIIPKPFDEVPTQTDEILNLEKSDSPAIYQLFNPAASCYVYGHSHIQTFDKVSYRTGAHGCTYPLALKDGIQDFAIYGTFKAQSDSGHLASALTYVSLFDLKNKLRVQLGQGLEVNYEGKSVKTPYHKEKMSIWYDDAKHYVYVYDHDIGVELRWDGEAALRIRISGVYEDSTKGLCGTFNSDQSDEINMLTRSPIVASDYQNMVQAWELPSCNHNTALYNNIDECVPSSEDRMTCVKALTRVELGFCVTKLPPIHFIDRCVQDLCRCSNDEECKCEIVSAYAQMCEDLISSSVAWRSDDFCPENMCLYNKNGCHHGCKAPGICFCDPGFDLAGDGKSCLVKIVV